MEANHGALLVKLAHRISTAIAAAWNKATGAERRRNGPPGRHPVTQPVLTRMKKAQSGAGVVSFPLIALFHPCYPFAVPCLAACGNQSRRNEPEAGKNGKRFWESETRRSHGWEKTDEGAGCC